MAEPSFETARRIGGDLPVSRLGYGAMRPSGQPGAAEAAKRSCAPSQMALAWLLALSPIIVPIPGTHSIAHLEENVGALRVSLTPAEAASLQEPARGRGQRGSDRMIVDDFRSDTVTRPGEGMRAAMAAAEVGDAVYDDCPTTKRLEAMAAERLGKEAALFFPTGTQANLAGLMAHCGRGEEYLVGQMAHTYRLEGGGAAVLGSIQPQPLPNELDGTIALDAIVNAIKPNDFHFAITRLLALENTFNGLVLPDAYLEAATQLARSHGLATHVDGARLMNAASASGRDAAWIAAQFDTVSLCLSKGLGAPVGSVLVGPKDFVEKARRIRKMLGGGMRQTGVLAAAAIYALEHNVTRLSEDHRRAAALAEVLARFPDLGAGPSRTNMVFMTPKVLDTDAFAAFLRSRGIAVGGRYGTLRWVTHLDVDDASVERVAEACEIFFDRHTAPAGLKAHA